MGEVFRTVLNAGFQGSVVIVLVMILRVALKRAPKKYICLLWILAAIRLLIPFSVESALSLQPAGEIVSQQQWQDLQDNGRILPEDAPMEMPQPYVPETDEQITAEELPKTAVITRTELCWVAIPWVWLIGIGLLWVHSLISWLLLKRRVREAVHLTNGVWECSGLGTAFIMGYLRPRIYIPMNISVESRHHILKHEWCHLKRLDHWVKLFAFIALTVHWFNPLVWIFYLLLCRDIEMACDEAVVRDLSLEERKVYSAALLECSAGRMRWAACPVAFGEVSVKRRILNVLNYRKKSLWFALMAAAAILFVAVCLLTDPATRVPDLSMLNYENIISAVAERDVFQAVHYTAEGEESNIGIGMVEGTALARYLDNADWKEKWFEPSDISSPGSVAFNIAADYRLTVYDRRFAAVKFGEEVRYYRIGRGDYQTAVGILLPPDEVRLERDFDIMLGTATMAPDWGVSLYAERVSAIGMTLHLERSGGTWPGELLTGRYYWLESWNGSEWEVVEAIGDSVFTTEGIIIVPEGKHRWSLNWKERYGELSPGIYRIGKSISNRVTQFVGVDLPPEAREEIEWDFYGEFEIAE